MTNKIPTHLSSCCKAGMNLCGSNGGSLDDTMWYQCQKCLQPCDEWNDKSEKPIIHNKKFNKYSEEMKKELKEHLEHFEEVFPKPSNSTGLEIENIQSVGAVTPCIHKWRQYFTSITSYVGSQYLIGCPPSLSPDGYFCTKCLERRNV